MVQFLVVLSNCYLGNIAIQCNLMFQFVEMLYETKDYEQRTN
jgi:hypothetical protein